MPDSVGITDDGLQPCPDTPNCVRSGDGGQPPFTPRQNLANGWEEIVDVAATLPRTRVVTRTDRYAHLEVTSLIFRFVDDLELLWDPEAGVIHFRSASRLGQGDLGVNQKRIDKLREMLSGADLLLGSDALAPQPRAPTRVIRKAESSEEW